MTVESAGSTGSDVLARELSSYRSGEKKLGKDDFLTLLVAQLRHQDPLNPMDSTQFTTQLAQYSSLEQLYNVNDNLESLQSSQEQTERYRLLDFIGKEIVAEGNSLYLDDTGAEGRFILDRSAACMVRIMDEDGYYLKELPLGVLPAGEHIFEWDGRNASGMLLDDGAYYFSVIAVGKEGDILPVQSRITGEVGSVRMSGSSPTLYIGNLPVSVSDVLEIRVPRPDDSATSSEDPVSSEADT